MSTAESLLPAGAGAGATKKGPGTIMPPFMLIAGPKVGQFAAALLADAFQLILETGSVLSCEKCWRCWTDLFD